MAIGASNCALGRRVKSAIVKVFGCRPDDDGATHSGAGVRKPPREETAGRDTRRFVTRYGDLIAADDAVERRRDDPAHWPTAKRLVSKGLAAWAGEGSCSM